MGTTLSPRSYRAWHTWAMCNLDIINHLEREGEIQSDDHQQARVLINHIVAAIEGTGLPALCTGSLITLRRLLPIHCSTTGEYFTGLIATLDSLVQVWWCRSSQWDCAGRTDDRTRGYLAASNPTGTPQHPWPTSLLMILLAHRPNPNPVTEYSKHDQSPPDRCWEGPPTSAYLPLDRRFQVYKYHPSTSSWCGDDRSSSTQPKPC